MTDLLRKGGEPFSHSDGSTIGMISYHTDDRRFFHLYSHIL
jgi:hypothetical protein